MSAGDNIQDLRKNFAISNRWVNTIYNGYGIIKQRILRHIWQHPDIQQCIWAGIKGKGAQFKGEDDYLVPLDMSTIVHFNNYYQVRKALKEMSTQDISVYWDPTYKHFRPDDFRKGPLLNGFDVTREKRIVNIRIKKSIAQALVRVDPGEKRGTPAHFTQFDCETMQYSRCKYMQPLYLMICSYANNKNSGFQVDIETLRLRLQVEEKYKGYADLNKYILKFLQEELKRFGKWCFNHSPIKTGKTVTAISFKIFKNKTPFNYNDSWLKLQRALDGDDNMPWFKQISFDQRENFNYLLTPGMYDLDEVYKKLQHIHAGIVKKKNNREKIHSIFMYVQRALHERFPPPA